MAAPTISAPPAGTGIGTPPSVKARRQNTILSDQLKTVAAEGARDNYFMGERYDMDYVYYIDGKDAHGAEQYYEYPNVYAAVLISKFLGLTVPADADLAVAPHLTSYGTVEFDIPRYAVRYSYTEEGFTLKNLSSRKRKVRVDLSALGAGTSHLRLSTAPGNSKGEISTVLLAPQAEARWVPVH